MYALEPPLLQSAQQELRVSQCRASWPHILTHGATQRVQSVACRLLFAEQETRRREGHGFRV